MDVVDKKSFSGSPCFLLGDSLETLKKIPSGSVDLVLTSPPYVNLRKEQFKDLDGFLSYFLKCTLTMKRLLKDKGSMWLNFGNYYENGSLVLLGEKVVSSLLSRQHWILVNDVIWRKNSFLPSSSKKRLANSYEHIFHLVKQKDYYVNQEAFKTYKRKKNSSASYSGVTGTNYLRKIKDSPYLSESEKEKAKEVLRGLLIEVKEGKLVDFRLLIRGDTSIINGSNSKRAQEVDKNGFAILRYLDYGMLSDVWDVSVNVEGIHDSPYPEGLCLYPIIATCPKGGLVLDPFCGSGTTNLVAERNGRRSIGIDIDPHNIELCRQRTSDLHRDSSKSCLKN